MTVLRIPVTFELFSAPYALPATFSMAGMSFNQFDGEGWDIAPFGFPAENALGFSETGLAIDLPGPAQRVAIRIGVGARSIAAEARSSNGSVIASARTKGAGGLQDVLMEGGDIRTIRLTGGEGQGRLSALMAEFMI